MTDASAALMEHLGRLAVGLADGFALEGRDSAVIEAADGAGEGVTGKSTDATSASSRCTNCCVRNLRCALNRHHFGWH